MSDDGNEEGGGIAGWALLILLLGYTLFCHQGLGLPAANASLAWYMPNGFLNGWPVIGEYSENWIVGAVILLIPAALLATGVFLKTASAVARALARSGVVAVLLFSYYSFQADRVWEFFHWRASIVFAGMAIAIGFTLASPLLAQSWLRLGGWGKALTYLPLTLGIVTLERHATGWDESLFFNFSPWPALPLFGLEIGAFSLIGILLGIALGLSGIASLQRSALGGMLLVAAGLVLPVVWFIANPNFSSIPGIPILSPLFFAGAIGIALTSIVRAEDRSAILARRAGYIALGAALAYFPIFVGAAMQVGDYTATKFVTTRQISDALAVHLEKEDSYPDELSELVEKSYLDEIPVPRVGFPLLYALGWLPEVEFAYRGLGSSYVLEFVSTKWIQCAYNPPWDEDEYAEEDAEYAEEYPDAYDDGSGEAWSCPESPPPLW